MLGMLKTGSLLYVLSKGENPSLNVGQVLNVTAPRPKIVGQFMPNPLQTEHVVDINVKVGDDTKTFTNVNANLNLVDTGEGGYVISDDKTAITNEVERLGTLSQNVLDSVAYHKRMVAACKQMMLSLNPSLRKESERDEEMSKMKGEMSEMRQTIAELANLLKGALTPQQPSMGSSLIRKE